MERIGNFAPRIDIEIGSALRNNSDLSGSRSCRERNCNETKKKKNKEEKTVALPRNNGLPSWLRSRSA